MEKTLDQMVEDWNKAYAQLGREIRIKDMYESDYEETIAEMLYEAGGNCWGRAWDILTHENNKGGWMMGDVHGFIRNKIEEDRS